MSPLTLNPEHQRHPRSGFSLVELMAVIAIIAILLALLLPALFNVRVTVGTTAIATEIKGFEQGIAEFKSQYGMEPPSWITLYEEGGAWDTQSTVLIQSMWPQFDFTADRDLDRDGTAGESDPDGDGTNGITLTGDECLLFFLGGSDTIVFFNTTTLVYGDTDSDGDQDIGAVGDGFSSNPQNPFGSGGNRVGPFGEFDPDRMIDVDGDGVHAYKDPFVDTNSPYLYLSSYDGRGYRPAKDGDLNQNSSYDATTEIQDVYLQATDHAWKDKSHQIICAGADAEFGVGGLWSSENGFANNSGDTSKDRDNITNFNGGTLE